MDSIESPFQFERQSTHGILALNPLINDGQWGTVTEVGNEILPQLETLSSPSVVIDLSRLNYIGSPQVALLVRVWKSLKKLQGRMAIACPNETVRDILHTAGLRSLWAIVDTHDAALTALGVPCSPQPKAESRSWFDLSLFWPAAKTAEAK